MSLKYAFVPCMHYFVSASRGSLPIPKTHMASHGPAAMMNDSQYNSQSQSFTPGAQTKPRSAGRGARNRVRQQLPGTVEDEMAWSPEPMDIGRPSTDGFSVGKDVNFVSLEVGRGTRRRQSDGLTIPNVPIGRTVQADKVNVYRRKGNHAFKMQDYEAACEKYSGAIHAASSAGTSKLLAGLPLLYCNRAAAYLALGKPVEALQDCNAGMRRDPSFHKCRFRAATCLVRMGRFSEAREALGPVLADGSVSSEVLKRKQEIDDAEEKFASYLKNLKEWQFDGMESVKAAYKVVEARVPHSEALVASLVVAHIQYGDFSGADKILDVVLKQQAASPSEWAGWCRVQTCFFKADYLQCERNLAALDGLLARRRTCDGIDENGGIGGVHQVVSIPGRDSIESMRQGIRSVQGLKDQANAQVKHKAYKEAAETYTCALSASYVSPAMASILFSNRAAAYQSAGHWALALADCCRAVSLSPQFAKPHSRMANILMSLGLHAEAHRSIERAISCAADAAQRSQYRSVSHSWPSCPQGLGQQPDFRMLLGLQHGSTEGDAKKSYRKLALKLHPDKTSQSVKVQYHLGPAGTQLMAAEETQRQLLKHATWLFKLLGEAHEALTR